MGFIRTIPMTSSIACWVKSVATRYREAASSTEVDAT